MSVLIESRLPLSHFSLTLCRKSLKSKPIKLCQIYCFPVLGRVIKYWPPILIRHGDQLFTGPQSHPSEFREFTGDINWLVRLFFFFNITASGSVTHIFYCHCGNILSTSQHSRTRKTALNWNFYSVWVSYCNISSVSTCQNGSWAESGPIFERHIHHSKISKLQRRSVSIYEYKCYDSYFPKKILWKDVSNLLLSVCTSVCRWS